MIHRFLETDQRLHDLARKNKANPYADQKRNRRDDGQRPFGARDQTLRFAVVALNTPPVSGFELGSEVKNLPAGILQVIGDLTKRRISFLNGLGDLRIKGIDTFSKLLDQMCAALVRSALDKIVQIALVGPYDLIDAIGLSLARLPHERNCRLELLTVLVQCIEGLLR